MGAILVALLVEPVLKEVVARPRVEECSSRALLPAQRERRALRSP
jgi:hypothetical protein